VTFRACPFCEVDWDGGDQTCWICGRKGIPGSIHSWLRLPKAMRVSYLKALAGERR
jgi:hypothetical protein